MRFLHAAALSSMQFTHYTPGHISSQRAGSNPATLQIFSIKLAKVAGGLHWPLSVYGVVAVRDVADHSRNVLFSRDMSEALELTQDVSIATILILFLLEILITHRLLLCQPLSWW